MIFGFILLLPIVYFIPIGLTKRSIFTLLLVSLVISFIVLVSQKTFDWWLVPLLLTLLSGLLTVLLVRFIPSSEIYSTVLPSDRDKPILNEVDEESNKETVSKNNQDEDDQSESVYDPAIESLVDYNDKEFNEEIIESNSTEFNQNKNHEIEETQIAEKIEEEKEEYGSKITDRFDEIPHEEGSLSPEEELLAARQGISEEPKQDRELKEDPIASITELDSDDFVIDEFQQEDLEKKELKEQFEDREGFERFDIDIIDEKDVPKRSSQVLKEDRSEFTDLEDLLQQRGDSDDQKDS